MKGSGTPEAALVVAVALQGVGREADAGRVQARAREAARFGEGEDVGPVVAMDAQQHAGLGALGAPVPVLAVQQHAVGAGFGQGERRGAAVRHLLGFLLLARRGHHLGAGVHQHHGGERLVGALGDAAHLLDVGRIELLDRRHQRLGAALELGPVDAALQQQFGVHPGAAAQAVGGGLAVHAAALARAAGEVDQGKRCVVGHGCLDSEGF